MGGLRLVARRRTPGAGASSAPESVRDMTRDHVTDEQKATSASTFFSVFLATHGWGYGLSVITKADDVSATPDRYGWFGGFGTACTTTPDEICSIHASSQSALSRGL